LRSAGAQAFKPDLELYLNRVYFGSGAYGVEAARSAILENPRKTSPLRKPRCSRSGQIASRWREPQSGRCREARPDVLTAMADAKFITETQAKASIGTLLQCESGAPARQLCRGLDRRSLDDLIGQIDQTSWSKLDRSETAGRCRSLHHRRLAAKSVKFMSARARWWR